MATKNTTIDGRTAYKTTGGRKIQPVYARDSSGKYDVSNIIKWRVIAYSWITAPDGKRVKSNKVSVIADIHPNTMSPADARALDRRIQDLLSRSQSSIDLLRSAAASLEQSFATSKLSDLIDDFDANSKQILSIIDGAGNSAATKAAVANYLAIANKVVAKIGRETDEFADKIEADTKAIANSESAITSMQQMSRLAVACLSYITDPDLQTSKATRQLYISYLRNHILVPTKVGSKSLGDMRIQDINKDALKSFELSLYTNRDGYRLDVDLTSPDGLKHVTDYLLNGGDLQVETIKQMDISPRTAKKIVGFISGVINYAMADPQKFSLANYQVNTVSKYKMLKSQPQQRKAFAPRTDEFAKLCAVAEQLDLTYMIPLMALVRCSFRPAEARGLRKADLTKVNVNDKQMDAAILAGSLVHLNGVGEHWSPTAKTGAALGDPVVIPSSVMGIINKYSDAASNYVVPASPGDGHQAQKPWLSKNAYQRAWARIKEAAGLDQDQDLYSLKHGLIAELLLAGWSPKAITLMTRHTTEEMVMQVYASIQSGDLANAIDALAESKQ